MRLSLLFPLLLPAVAVAQAEVLPHLRVATTDVSHVAVDGDRGLVVDSGRVLFLNRTSSGWGFEAAESAPFNARWLDADLAGDRAAGALVPPPNVLGLPPTELRCFRRSNSGWLPDGTIVDPLPGSGLFGEAVELDGDLCAVGAPSSESGVPGRVEVFARTSNGWVHNATLQAPILGGSSNFGWSLALDGERLAVGLAPSAQGYSVALFERQAVAWLHVATIHAPSANAGFFGHSLSLQGDRLVVGAPQPLGSSTPSGAAHVFERSQGLWTWTQTLQGAAGAGFDRFGLSVALDGGRLAVGAPTAVGAGPTGQGRVSLFELQPVGWTPTLSFGSPDPLMAPAFGTEVALSADRIAVSNFNLNFSAQFFELADPSSQPVTYCSGRRNPLNCLPTISTSGSPSASSAAPFLIEASGFTNGRAALLVYGLGSTSLAFYGGTLCVAAPLHRTPIVLTGGSPSGVDCTGSFSFDMNAWIRSGVDPRLGVGTTVYAQVHGREPTAAPHFGASNAVAFQIAP